MYNINSVSNYFRGGGGVETYDYRKELATKLENQTASGKNEKSSSTDIKEGINVELSSRAQKIQKLNEDFFPGGYQTIKITPEFINRLKEYGFLSSEEAEKLTPKIKAATEQKESVDLGDLSDFIGQFKDRLEKEEPSNSLIAALQKADYIINNFDTQTMKADIKTVINELKKFSNSKKAFELSTEDKDSLKKLETTMHIADKLSIERAASPQINTYLSVFNQFS